MTSVQTSLLFDVYRGPQRVLFGPNLDFFTRLGRQEASLE